MWKCPKRGRTFEKTQQSHCCTLKPESIEEYILMQDETIQPVLKEVYQTIRSALPEAQERISWQMPTFREKHNLIHFAAQKKHVGIYPGEEAVVNFSPALKQRGFKFSKGSIQMPYGKVDLDLIYEIAAWCGEE